MERQVFLKSLNIDPVVYFAGSKKKIREAEKKEKTRAELIERIIFDKKFNQLIYKTSYGTIRSLHFSTRKGVLYQLSYLNNDLVPVMHESYITTPEATTNETIHSKTELLQHFVNLTLQEDVLLKVISN